MIMLLRYYNCFLFLLISASPYLGTPILGVYSYPMGVPHGLSKNDLKDEKHFPNGTVSGKYNYVDREGNQVLVKYYADDSSYGVELKSIKLVDSNSEPTLLQKDKQLKFDTIWQLDTTDLPDYQNIFNLNSSKAKGLQSSDLNKDLLFNNESHQDVNNNALPDYDIYLQNELPASKCGKDKVRIYIDKGKRKIREILKDVARFKYFNKF